MQQQTTQLRQFIERVPFVVDMNIRPSDITQVADVVLPAAAWGEYTYTRENLERRLRVNQQFYDPPGEVRAEYLIFVAIAQRLAQRHGLLDAAEWAVQPLGGRLRRDAGRPSEGKSLGLDNITPQQLARARAPTASSSPTTREGNKLIGTERIYTDKFATDDGRARFVARDQNWTDADPLAFLPEPIKPNAQYPFFVTTVRYQTIWQSGYTYR